MIRKESLSVCKAFLTRIPADVQSALMGLLPHEEQLALQEIQAPAEFDKGHLVQDFIDEVHPSWLTPYLRTLAEADIRLYLAALPSAARTSHMKALGMSNHLPELSKLGKGALLALLKEKVQQNEPLVPLACLPDHPFNRLLTLTSHQLEELIRLLGMHDLSFEMRQIIDTKKLKAIFAALPKKEGEFLNTLLLQKEPLVFKRLFLHDWDGSKEMMRKLLQERGVHRLGQALFGVDQSFIWYLTHKVELHLGTLLLKYMEKPANERAEKLLREQINAAYTYLKPEVES